MPEQHSIFLDNIQHQKFDINRICRYHKVERNKILTSMIERANQLLSEFHDRKES